MRERQERYEAELNAPIDFQFSLNEFFAADGQNNETEENRYKRSGRYGGPRKTRRDIQDEERKNKEELMKREEDRRHALEDQERRD